MNKNYIRNNEYNKEFKLLKKKSKWEIDKKVDEQAITKTVSLINNYVYIIIY